MTKFAKDLDIGERAQNFIISILKKEYKDIHSLKGNVKECDLVSSSGYSAEVKFDIMSKETGNIGIEYKCNNKPSGISTTEALEWIHIFYADRWVYIRVATKTLQNFLRSNWNHLTKIMGGDGNRAELFIIPVDTIIDQFKCFPLRRG